MSVADEGPGIPAHEVERLFTPFESTSVKSTGGEKSTGLGLAIARKIVTGHGGRIWVESTPGKGSIFFLTIPLQI
jgi:signal transduction histidine kinase